MWVILFFYLNAQAATPAAGLDYEVFKTKVQPLLLEKRPGHARCSICHTRGTQFRLQPLSPGAATWNEEQSQKNFEAIKRFVLPGVPTKSRFLMMPLAHEAGGTSFHPGGKHWESQSDPEFKMLAAWVNGQK